MNLKHKVAAIAIATLFAGAASAQSTSKVQVNDINQNQSGLLNKQEMDLGNAKGGGKSDVKIDKVTQSQSGLLNAQKMGIGNAEGKGS